MIPNSCGWLPVQFSSMSLGDMAIQNKSLSNSSPLIRVIFCMMPDTAMHSIDRTIDMLSDDAQQLRTHACCTLQFPNTSPQFNKSKRQTKENVNMEGLVSSGLVRFSDLFDKMFRHRIPAPRGGVCVGHLCGLPSRPVKPDTLPLPSLSLNFLDRTGEERVTSQKR